MTEVEQLEARLFQIELELRQRTYERDMVGRLLGHSGVKPRGKRRAWLLPVVVTSVVLASLGGVAIGVRVLTHRGDKYAEALAKLDQFADQMCTCQTKDCAMHVSDDMTKWAQTMAKDADANRSKPDEESMKRAAESAKRLGDCMAHAITQQ